MRALMLFVVLAACLSLLGVSPGASPVSAAADLAKQEVPQTAPAEAVTPTLALSDMLIWLRDHQADDGSWRADTFAEAGQTHGRTGSYANADGTEDIGWTHASDGVTALASLAFLANGNTHRDGDYARQVRNSLRYLFAIQDADGCFGQRDDHHYIYNHCMATAAIAYDLAETGAANLRGPTQAAVNFISEAQNIDPDQGYLGWRYGVRPGDSDTSVTGWAALASLIASRVENVDVPERHFEGASRTFENLSEVRNGFWVIGYITRGGPNARLRAQARFLNNNSMGAIALAIWRYMGKPGIGDGLQSIAEQLTCAEGLPTAADPLKIDLYYWFWGTLAMRTVGGERWETWRNAAQAAVMALQIRDGEPTDARYGSLDTTTPWGVAGGRVYSTAMAALTLGMCCNDALTVRDETLPPIVRSRDDPSGDTATWQLLLMAMREDEVLGESHPAFDAEDIEAFRAALTDQEIEWVREWLWEEAHEYPPYVRHAMRALYDRLTLGE